MASVVAQCHHIFGLRKEVINNVCFLDEKTVVYPCGNFCVCYNTVERCQRFFPGMWLAGILLVLVSCYKAAQHFFYFILFYL